MILGETQILPAFPLNTVTNGYMGRVQDCLTSRNQPMNPLVAPATHRHEVYRLLAAQAHVGLVVDLE